MNPVIICGGVGTKMWPESRQKSPKHFLPLIEGKSLFQLNWEILRRKYRPEQIFLQTNKDQAQIARELVPEIVEENIFIEPEMRNQGPATGFAAASLYKKFPDEPFMLVQADVLREPGDKFLEMVEQFDKLIREKGKVVTAGMKPAFAVMGVDYLVVDPNTHQMREWLGRGDKETIEKFLMSGEALIHTNHYAWTPRLMLECFKRKKMEWYEPLMNIIEGGDVEAEYAKMPKGPIEEIMQTELTDGYVMELPFNWVDFGTWESLSKYLIEKGYYSVDNVEEIDSGNNYIRKAKDKFVATIGVEGLIIIDTGDALLVMKKEQSGKVGQVVDKLKEKERGELL
jgi:mannose-1-phosphate guanylyltransferase